jgi:hypothetical protein
MRRLSLQQWQSIQPLSCGMSALRPEFFGSEYRHDDTNAPFVGSTETI